MAKKRPLRNRIKEHRMIRAGDLLPHPLNWRRHPDVQRQTLQALYDEVGFARSLLAFERPDGQLQLIDGHLRRDLNPDALVTVEILDVTEEEARKLLLSIDPLVALASADETTLDELRRITEADHDVLNALWEKLDANQGTIPEPSAVDHSSSWTPHFLILITCQSEEEQATLLDRFIDEGITCKPLTSFGD